MTTTHRLDRHVSAAGYVASCSCGWRVTKRSREDREREAHAHETADTLTVRRVEIGGDAA